MKEEKKPILQHLQELRRVLLISICAVLVCFVLIFYFFSESLMDFITAPITNQGIQVIYTGIAEAFTTQLKVSLLVGGVAAFPIIAWQIWSFIKPALYPKERRAFGYLFILAVFLFILGVVFAYFVVYGLAVSFFLITGEGIAVPMLSISKYTSFLMGFLWPFGLMFQLPVVIYILARVGLVNHAKLSKARRYIILVVFIVAAILTPPDVLSQLLLAAPMLLLYEIGVLIARFVKPNEERHKILENKTDR